MKYENEKKSGDEIYKLLVDIKEKRVPASEKPLNLQGIILSNYDLSGMDLSGIDFSGADLTEVDLSNAILFKANITKATLLKANLTSAELSGADLTDANLEGIIGINLGLGMTNIRNTNFFNANLQGSTLSLATIDSADFRNACLRDARMRETRIISSDFTNADLRSTELSLSTVTKSNFTNADLRASRLRKIEGFEHAIWIGADIRDVNFAGAYRLRRFAMDQNYIKEFRERNRMTSLIYYLWWLSSDCGRSLGRWCVLIVLLVFSFAVLYTFVGIDYGKYPTVLSPLYYSVVTLTTLGYGDVKPASTGGQIIVMFEVIFGYIMLGGLLSIFNNKIARRAD